MDHKEELEFDLEDIIREFSDQPKPELDEFIREYVPKKQRKPQAMEGDTIRMDPIPVREPIPRFEGPRMPALQKEPDIEPFSEDWEPEYDEPMGQYTPKNPIPFPKDRARALREKLAEGPEKRFYELTAAGISRPRLSALIGLMIFLVSTCVTLAFTMGYIPPERIQPVIFCQLLAVLLAALLCSGRLVQGLVGLVRGRFTLSAFLLVTALVCLADAIICLQQRRISCCNIFCLEVALAQWAICHERNTEISRMDTLRKAPDLKAVAKIEDYYDGTAGYVSVPGEPEAFLDHYQAPSGPERLLHTYTAIAVLSCMALAIVTGVTAGWSYAMQVLTAGILVSLPATVFISMRRPEAVLENRMHSLGTVLCGWQGIRAVDRDVIFPISHKELFPVDAIQMNGMKFYGSVDPDMVLCYAGSLIRHEGGSLTAVFTPLMNSRYIRRALVEEYSSYPGGLSALVDGEPVAVGTLEFMHQMGIDVPKQAQIRHAVYAAVDGKLSGVFAVQYSRSKQAAAGLRNVCSYGRVKPVLITPDFILTHRFLRDTMKVNVSRLQLPDQEECEALRKQKPESDASVVALHTKDGLAQRAFAVTGAAALASAQRMGGLIHILGGILGIAAVAALSLAGAWHLLTPVNLLLYSLLWMIPGFLITEWTRYI